MYPWVTHTWNTVKGKCPHDCSYCYMKKWGEQPELHFDNSELKKDLGSDKFIFVGSGCDMWADSIPKEWITKTLYHISNYFNNRYLYQSKNPGRFQDFIHWYNGYETFATTIETNRWIEDFMQNSPPTMERYQKIYEIRKVFGSRTVVTIEPIMDFDLDIMVHWMQRIQPEFINIGANTNSKVKLPEPNPENIQSLIEQLKQITEVKIKSNLKRLLEYPK